MVIDDHGSAVFLDRRRYRREKGEMNQFQETSEDCYPLTLKLARDLAIIAINIVFLRKVFLIG